MKYCHIREGVFVSRPNRFIAMVELVYIKKGKGNLTVDFREYPVSGPCMVLILPVPSAQKDGNYLPCSWQPCCENT